MRTLLATLILSTPLLAPAQEAPEAEQPKIVLVDLLKQAGIKYQSGPGTMDIGGMALLPLPEGFIAADGPGSRAILELMGNLTGDSEVGIFGPEDFSWFVTFDWDGIGYIKDADKEKLDAKAMLEAMQEGNRKVNKIKAEKGLDTFTLVGFDVEPNYNPKTNNLEWALRLRDDKTKGDTINYNVRVLGRHGVMRVTLVCDPIDLSKVLPEFRKHLAAYSYNDGHRYAEFRKGDSIAKAGLTALVVGGGLALAAKSGLLQKLLKPLIIAVIAGGAFIKRLFTGRSKE